ncbi:hypothetical protein VULLAG_LOCUS18182 [Vulpes lagopus]
MHLSIITVSGVRYDHGLAHPGSPAFALSFVGDPGTQHSIFSEWMVPQRLTWMNSLVQGHTNSKGRDFPPPEPPSSLAPSRRCTDLRQAAKSTCPEPESLPVSWQGCHPALCLKPARRGGFPA